MKKIQKKTFWKLAVMLCVLAVLCGFVSRKEGYHMDELLSFELSNAEFNPWIVPTQPVGRLAKYINEEIRGESFGETAANLIDTVKDVLINREQSKMLQYKADVYPEPVWIGRDQFQEYVTVGEKDRFNYLSVYFNVKDDNHPPLHFMLLHTMSSLFPGTTAPFVGCAINILAVLGCIFCFFELGELFEKGGVLPEGRGLLFGCCASLLYGLSQGAIATTLLIRMYGLVTFFCVALFTIHVKKWQESGFEKKNKALAAVTALGFWTQYFFLFYCLTLAAVTAGLLLAKKRRSELMAYIRTMLCSGVIGVVLFPFSISDVFSSERGVEALGNLGSGFAGYDVRLKAFCSILLQRCFGGVTLLSAALAYFALVAMIFWIRRKKEQGWLALMLVVPCVVYFLLTAKMSPYLVDRYIMPLFPFGALFLALALTEALRKLTVKQSGLALALAAALGIVNCATYDGSYLYQGYEEQLEVAGEYRELPCVCLYEGYGYYYNLLEFTRYQKTLLSTASQLEVRQDVEELKALDRLVILQKSNVSHEALDRLLVQYGWEVEEELLSPADSVYGDRICLVRRKTF